MNNVLVLVNEHVDPSFLFQNSSSYNINNEWEKNDLTAFINSDKSFLDHIFKETRRQVIFVKQNFHRYISPHYLQTHEI